VVYLRKAEPNRPRGFKVPFVPWFPWITVIMCLALMSGLLLMTWVRFVVWLAIGLVIYFFYSRKHSEFAKT
jgi:basic amino acid/polyamine antiporter, APA family